MSERKLILISNDDGYQAKGINSLVEMVCDLADIIVCAPNGARSGFSKAVTAEKELTVDKVSEDGSVQVWSCSGSPVDCIKLALCAICPRLPDLVIGGINHGDNSGFNAHFSATVGLVTESCLRGIPSIAFSLCDYDEDADFMPMTRVVRKFVMDTLNNGLPYKTCLSINVPKGTDYKGIKYCRMAMGRWNPDVINLVDSGDHKTFGISFFNYRNAEVEDDSFDSWAVAHGFVAVTPLTLDCTDNEFLKKVKNKNIEI